jgi:hypothetical protein
MKQNKYCIIVITVLIIILFTQKCGKEILKTEFNKQKEVVKTMSLERLREKDSLEYIISQREKVNDSLLKNITSIEKEIDVIRNKVVKVPKKPQEFSDYFNSRYNIKENLVIDDKVTLGSSTSTLVVLDLEEGDKNLKIIPLKDRQLLSKDSIISNLNSDKKDLSLQIFSAEKEISERIKLEELANKSIKTLERKNKWNKVYVIGGVIGGFLIGNQLSK